MCTYSGSGKNGRENAHHYLNFSNCKRGKNGSNLHEYEISNNNSFSFRTTNCTDNILETRETILSTPVNAHRTSVLGQYLNL